MYEFYKRLALQIDLPFGWVRLLENCRSEALRDPVQQVHNRLMVAVCWGSGLVRLVRNSSYWFQNIVVGLAVDLEGGKCLLRPKKEMDRYQLHGVVWCGMWYRLIWLYGITSAQYRKDRYQLYGVVSGMMCCGVVCCAICYAMLCYAVPCYAMLCYVMLYAMPCYAMLCYAICYAKQCNAMLCYSVL